MKKDKKALTLKTLNKSNVWDLQENDIFRLWDAAEKDADMKDSIRHYLDIIKSAFDGKIDLPLGRNAQQLDLDGLPDLYMFVYVAYKSVGHFGNVNQAALSAGERDKRPELRDTGNLPLKNLADLPIHGLSSLCLWSPAIRLSGFACLLRVLPERPM